MSSKEWISRMKERNQRLQTKFYDFRERVLDERLKRSKQLDSADLSATV